jgi:Fic family protein
MIQSTYKIPALPLRIEIETKRVLKAAALANRHLAELKGRASAIPNPGILVASLFLQEAKASSEIENIVTTQDELFQFNMFAENPQSTAAKEVSLYRDALQLGFQLLQRDRGLITNNHIIEMFRVLKGHRDGFRQKPGTALKNDLSGEIIYVPPQNADDILKHMTALEKFINQNDLEELDPLVKMAIIHHQFESIHPFTDGNGRLGRIINVLFLVKAELLDSPVLYLSRYITSNKDNYYALLQSVRDTGDWEPWLLYMLKAVSETSQQTLEIIDGIKTLMFDYKQRLRNDHPRIYSQDLLNNLFRHPYTRIEFVADELKVSRQTASKYLEQLSNSGLLEKQIEGRNSYYVNQPLVDLFIKVSGEK